MQTILWQLAAAATLAASTVSFPALASAVVDFDDPSLETVYAPDDSFIQNGFLMTQIDDAGLVGSNYDLGAVAPTGDSTLYYSNFNNGALLVQRVDGGTFSLLGFDVAFVPLVPAPGAQTLVLGVISLDAAGNVDFPYIFDYPASTTAGNPFGTFASTGFPGAYQNVTALEFFSCSLNAAGTTCLDPRNNGQFALDNLTFAVPVPEPTSAALMVLGLIGLVAGKRLRDTASLENSNRRPRLAA